METQIKYFSNQELRNFFKQLEADRLNSITDYAVKCAVRNEALFKVMYYCALRATETTMLEVDSFNALKNEIYCKRIKGGLNNTLEIIDMDVLRSLKRHLSFNSPKKYLFENMRDDKSLSRKTLDKIFKETCSQIQRSISKRKWHCHTLRHTRAINLAEKGLDLKELQYWLGHSEISNTLIYFSFTSKQCAALYKKLKKGAS